MSKKSGTFDEMLRLYKEENLSLQQIGDCFGIKRQAVHDRFRRAGIKLRPNNHVRKVFTRELLVKLYEEDNLTIGEIAEKLNVGFAKISAELDRHSITKHSINSKMRKYPELWNMQPADMLIVPRPASVKPYSALYSMAKNAGIKISIKTISAHEISITCRSITQKQSK